MIPTPDSYLFRQFGAVGPNPFPDVPAILPAGGIPPPAPVPPLPAPGSSGAYIPHLYLGVAPIQPEPQPAGLQWIPAIEPDWRVKVTPYYRLGETPQGTLDLYLVGTDVIQEDGFLHPLLYPLDLKDGVNLTTQRSGLKEIAPNMEWRKAEAAMPASLQTVNNGMQIAAMTDALRNTDLQYHMIPLPSLAPLLNLVWQEPTLGTRELQRIRLLIGDDEQPYYFHNRDLTEFYLQEYGDVYQTAAMALETWAGRIAYDEGAFQAGGVSVNGPAMAQEKRQRAQELRMRLIQPGYVGGRR